MFYLTYSFISLEDWPFLFFIKVLFLTFLFLRTVWRNWKVSRFSIWSFSDPITPRRKIKFEKAFTEIQNVLNIIFSNIFLGKSHDSFSKRKCRLFEFFRKSRGFFFYLEHPDQRRVFDWLLKFDYMFFPNFVDPPKSFPQTSIKLVFDICFWSTWI